MAKKTFMCIRDCQAHETPGDPRSVRLFKVGETWMWDECPSHHFVEVGKKDNPIGALRKKLEDLNIVWDKEWSMDRLQREIDVAENRGSMVVPKIRKREDKKSKK
jgi:hypothetical protein